MAKRQLTIRSVLNFAAAGILLGALCGIPSEPAKAQTRDRIFGIALGQGGVQKCPTYRFRFRNGIGGMSTTRRWAYPRGFRKYSPFRGSDQAEANEIAGACFVPTELFGGDPESKRYRRPAPGTFERVMVIWPYMARPRFPGMIGSARPQILGGLAIDGSVESITIATTGVISQDAIYAQLVRRFGQPRSQTNTEVVASDGKRETSRNAVWVTPDFHVTMQGITAGRRAESIIFGAGEVNIRTHKGQRLFESNRTARPRFNL